MLKQTRLCCSKGNALNELPLIIIHSDSSCCYYLSMLLSFIAIWPDIFPLINVFHSYINGTTGKFRARFSPYA